MRNHSRYRPRFGAHWDGEKVRFSVAAPNAERVEVCCYSPDGLEEVGRFDLKQGPDGRWSAERTEIGPGQLYGYRVSGPFDPASGHRFDPQKLLMDPAATAITGEVRWSRAIHSIDPGGSASPGKPNRRDSAPFVPRSRVIDPTFDWREDRRPATPWSETLIYECHVRGSTIRHPEIPQAIRGTYLGLAHPAFIAHLLSLRVTALELMPVHHFTPERHLASTGRTNYWGYSPLAYYAPHAGYATGDDGRQVDEFRTLVRELHRVGIEVILDVVLNHTVEGDAAGPTLSLRGLDNRTYYRTDPKIGEYIDFTGCGHSLNFGNPTVDDFALDCLRYWVDQMHVDGFRFDLATISGRTEPDFDAGCRFFESLQDGEILGDTKLIAEPWDVGPNGYQLGRFPTPWREWNDRYRDTARAFWRGDRGQADGLEKRIRGSADLVREEQPERGPWTINYLASHDGFTLRDLVSYEERHNWANGEGNRDGHGHNLSRNWGVEGETEDKVVLERRRRATRNLLATLFLSEGTPMLGHGDEFGRTQLGNNNAYCQDGPCTWVDWELCALDESLLNFVQQLASWRVALGIGAPAFHWQPLPSPEPIVDARASDRVVALWSSAAGLLLGLSSADDEVELRLPEVFWQWQTAWCTAGEMTPPLEAALKLPPRSVVLLSRDVPPVEPKAEAQNGPPPGPKPG